MRVTVDSVDKDEGLGGAAGQSSVDDAPAAIAWTPGEEAPPLTIDHPAAVALCVQIISGAVGDLPAIVVTEAVAVQVYRLVRDKKAPPELKASVLNATFVILASLARRTLVARDAAAARRLDIVLARKDKQAPGLHHALRLLAGQRKDDAEMCTMSYEDATNHLLKRWDLLPLGNLLPGDFHSMASGGGGGDPGGDGSGEQMAAAAAPSPAPSPAHLDPRTRCLDRILAAQQLWCRRRAERRGQEPTPWAERGLSFDVLLLLDGEIRKHKMRHQAKRALTFERQLVDARQQLDEARAARDEAQVLLLQYASDDVRARRVLEQERSNAADLRRQAADALAALRAEHATEQKRERAVRAADRRELQAEARRERIESDERLAEADGRVVLVEGMLTSLERQLERSSSRKALHAALEEATQAQAEAARVRNQSRAWARVHDEEARADRLEVALEAALRRADEHKAALAQRSTGRQIEHQELLRLRARVKELQEKVATYQARSNRRFFDFDPIQEENERLRQELEQLEQTAREQLAAAQSAAEERLAEAEKAAAARLAEVEAEAGRVRAIAEPPKQKFFARGHYTSEVDLAALEIIATLGVSANVVPALFVMFARFFGVKIPSRTKKVLTGTAAGKRVYEWKDVLYIPGKTHMKELPAIGNELHAIQAGAWLLEDPEASYCYVADAANSQQREILAQLLYRRNKETGKLESMAMSIDEIGDKTSVGQQKKFKSALASIAEAWGEAAELGVLDDGWQPQAEAAEPAAEEPSTAAGFFEQQRKGWRARQKRKLAELTPASAMNDRAAPARKAARLARGGDGSGGSDDVADDPTCAHHAVANVGEEGRKAIDKILKEKMAITDEQAESDASKVKALRTSVGWFSSPACSLIYQCSKYVALFSSKGYAIGANFATWLAHKLKTTEQLAGEIISHVEDLLAICGGRDYVFFLDAAVVDRFSQLESLYGYLLEEADMGAEAGGKLRKAIITGFESVYCMSAVRSMAVIADAWLWPMLRAIEPGDDVHVLDVCPELWPRTCAWLEEAAASPQSAIDGTLCLRTSLEAANLRTTPRKGPTASSEHRAERAAIDLRRVRAAIDSDAELKALVHDMLSAAFTAMATSVRNHAAEFMPGGCCCKANITPALRQRLDGMPLTSVGAETMFARVKRRAERGGIARHDTRMGAVLCERDATVAWAREQTDAAGLLRLACTRWRKGSGSRTMADEDALKGEAKAPEREAKLAKKRSGRAAKAADVERLKAVAVVSTYSALKKMGNEDLSDQLKIFKKLEKKTGFKTTGSGSEMRLQLQSLIFEKYGAGANDLADGDSGLEGRAANDGKRRKRKVAAAGGGGGSKKKSKKKKSNMVSLNDWEWEADEIFEIERLIGKMVADGGEVPGRTAVVAGTVLYKVLWQGFPPDIATWESEDDLAHTDEVQLYEAGLAEEQEQEAEEGEADI